MKIVVIAAARSRSTLLTYYLHTLNDVKPVGEYYTYSVNKGNINLEDITKSLFAEGKFITKIIGHNLIAEYTPDVFKLEEYNQIHLIERYDFFEQCCSMLVAKTLKIWHVRYNDNSKLKQHALLRNRKFTLTVDTIMSQGKDVMRYLEIKKYLIDNNIPFTLHTYDDAIHYAEYQRLIEKNNISYDSVITNYHLKKQVNSLFNEFFCYEKSESDLETFLSMLSKMF
jgi:hypothetical protein